jgi:hypothetical protein
METEVKYFLTGSCRNWCICVMNIRFTSVFFQKHFTYSSSAILSLAAKSRVVYCVVTEANLGIMLCRHDMYPS